jgi:flagellar hook-basal body complex protein FliE
VNPQAIQAIVPNAPLDAPDWATAAAAQQAAPAGETFGRLISEGISQVNGQLAASEVVQNLHHVMMRLEESRLSFQLMMQVRNRLLEAYQDVMKMQI